MFQIKKYDYDPNLIVFILIGEFAKKRKLEFLKEIENAQRETPQQIFVNLAQVTSIDCMALGSLLLAHRRSKQFQIEFALIVSQGSVKQALEFAGIDNVIPMIVCNPHNDFPLK